MINVCSTVREKLVFSPGGPGIKLSEGSQASTQQTHARDFIAHTVARPC